MKNEMNQGNKIIMIVAGIVAVGIIALAVASIRPAGTEISGGPSKYDAFAQCLANAGATMYGAAWCPHCQEQKATFGSSFQYVKYVECPDNTALCIAKGVQGYPTWMIGSTTIEVGFDKNTTMAILASSTGCVLPGDEPADAPTVSSPRPGATVTSPLAVSGKVSGSWFFEGSFPVELVASDGTVIAQGVAHTPGDWATTSLIDFSATLTYPRQAHSVQGSVVIKNDNPSGDPAKDKQMSVPVTIR
ncbi:MAG: hypothetical protein KGH93_03375 [Patescibacteria group bacterium]|nr:hypothetical protein [Patescibacteria group bacterium]MDE1946206.1 hypothetical protein [Patescibacteria group bacterium]